MRKSLCLMAALAITSFATSHVEAKPIQAPGSLGIGLGSGTFANGLSLKYFMADALAIQGNVGVAGGSGGNRFKDNGGIAASADLLLERGPLLSSEIVDLNWNLGAGAGLSIRSDVFGLAASGIAGLELDFNVVPIDLVIEYRPSLLIVPDVEIDLIDFTAHIRFYIQ